MLNPRSLKLTRPFFLRLPKTAILVKALLFLLFETLFSAMFHLSIHKLQVILFSNKICLNLLWISKILDFHLYMSLFSLSLFAKVSKKLREMYLYLVLRCFTHSLTTPTSFESFFLACSVRYFQTILKNIPIALIVKQKAFKYLWALKCKPYLNLTFCWDILYLIAFTMFTADIKVNHEISNFI